jgi:hypothetical protein
MEPQQVTMADLRSKPMFHVWNRGRGGDFATAAGVGRDGAYALVHSGEVASIRVGRKIMVPSWAILRWLGYDDQDAA